MEVINGKKEDAREFLAKHGMRIFEIVSYFLEQKHQVIREEHLVMEGWHADTLTEVIEKVKEEIEHYGIERLFLSQQILLEYGTYFKGYRLEFPLGEITENGELDRSDLWAKFNEEEGTVKLAMFDVP